VCVSHDLRRWLVEDVRIAASKVVTVHNGVELTRFTGAAREAARSALGLGVSDVLIGTVGRLDPVKDQATLLRAFGRLVPRHADARLIVVGDGPLRAQLDQLINSLGLRARARLLGERRDIPAILAALDVFVLPSIAEGISNTILEAMASGLPIVATRVGGNSELIDPDSTGALVPVGHAETLAAAIERYVDDAHLREVHGKRARARARERFSLERMSHDYGALYKRVLHHSAKLTA
jgi:sugar transferase (PEP-CTERM/EpsH1 system associated)